MPSTRRMSDSGILYYDQDGVVVGSGWTLVTVVPVANIRGYAMLDLLNSGANALTAMRIVRSSVEGAITDVAIAGSDYIVIAEDADINVPSVVIDHAYPNPVYTLASSACAQISVLCDGAAEIGVFAKSSSGTTLKNRRTILPRGQVNPPETR